MKTKKIEYIAVVNPIGEFRTARKCAVCGDPASREVMRAVKGRAPHLNTLRFACARHATVELLYPVRVVVKLEPLLQRRRNWIPLRRGDDHSMFYRDVMREMGGVVPMPDRETKDEIEDKKSVLKRRAKNWPALESHQWKDVKLDELGKDRSLGGRQRKKWKLMLRRRLKAVTLGGRQGSLKRVG